MDDLIVVKLGSGNDRKTRDLHRFDRYLGRPELWSTSAEEIKSLGFYELARNWVIACELAEGRGARHAVLVNLAPSGHAVDVERFRGLVAISDARRVAHLRWASLLPDPAPRWLEDYAAKYGLRQR